MKEHLRASPEQNSEAAINSSIGLTPEQDAAIDALVENGPYNYAQAIYRVTGNWTIERASEPEPPEPEVEPNGQLTFIPRIPCSSIRRIDKPPRPPLSAREKEVADRRPDLKPSLPRLEPVTDSTPTREPYKPSPEPDPKELLRDAYKVAAAYGDNDIPAWVFSDKEK